MRMIPLAVAIAAMTALPVIAQTEGQTPAPRPAPILQSLDFAAADTNNDGTVSPEEWEAYLARVTTERTEAMTATRAEMDRLRAEMRELRGTDHEMRGSRRGDHAGRAGMRGADRAPLTEEQRAERLDQAFTRLDADGDGQISRDEFEAAAAQRFALMQERMDRGPRRHGWRR